MVLHRLGMLTRQCGAWKESTIESMSGICIRQSSSWKKVLETKLIELDEGDLEEKFVKGGGNGGQKINKVRNSVFLKHIPTGLFVQCQKTRSLDDNRRVARKLLIAQLDDHVNGNQSKRNLKIQKAQRKKARKKAKSRQKHGGQSSLLNSQDRNESNGSDGEEDNDDDDECDDDDDDEWDDDEDANAGKLPA